MPTAMVLACVNMVKVKRPIVGARVIQNESGPIIQISSNPIPLDFHLNSKGRLLSVTNMAIALYSSLYPYPLQCNFVALASRGGV